MAADGVKALLDVYEKAIEHLRKAREGLDRLESASSMASDAHDTTKDVKNDIAQSLLLCEYIKCRVPSLSPEPQRAQWNGNVERIEHETGMLQKRLDAYMSRQGVFLLVGAMNSKGKQKEQVRKKLSDISTGDKSFSKSSEKKRKKRNSELSCGTRVHVFSKEITKNVSHNNQLELGKTFCENLWGQNVPWSVILTGVNSEGEEKSYEIYILGTRLSKGFSEFINHQKFCIHRGNGLELVDPNPSSDLGQSLAGSMADMFPPLAGHCGTPALPLAPPAIARDVKNFEEDLAEFETSKLAQALEEDVRKEYLALCKQMMCLPHERKLARYYAMRGIPLIVKVLRQMRTVDIRKEGLASIKMSLQLLEDWGFECEFLSCVFEKISSAQESFKACEKEQDELRARMAALDLRFRMFQGTF